MVSQAENLLTRFSAMQSERALVDPFYYAAASYFDPLQAQYWGRTSAEKKGPTWNGDLYSGAGIGALNRLSTFLQGNATPASAKWLLMQDANPDVNENSDGAQFWADTTMVIERDLRGTASMGSSFYTTKRMQYRYMAISQGVSYIYEGEEGGVLNGQAVYEAVPAHAFWYQLDAFGRMECGAYRRSMTEGEAQSMIGQSVIDAEIDEEKHAKSSDRVAVIQMILRNPLARAGLPRDPEEFPYVEYWIHEGDKKILKVRGYRSQPFHVMGWDRLPNSNYHVGPVYSALPDMVSAAAARKAQLQAMAWAGSPPLLGGRKIEGAAKTLQPRRITWNALGKNGNAQIAPMQTGSNPGTMFQQVSDDESRVRSMMFNDELLNQRRPKMSATEASLIAQERAAMVAPFAVTTIPSIRGEMARHFEIKLRTGGLPDVPGLVAQAGDFDADVVGPLALAARQAEVGSMMQTFEQAAMIEQVQSQYLDTQEALKLVAEKNGHSAILRDFEEVKAEKEAEAEMQNAAINAEMQNKDADTLGKVASAGATMQ